MRWYGVYKARRSTLAAIVILALTVVAMFTPAPTTRALQAAAYQEKLPIYSVHTTEKKVALGINCAWDNADIPDLIAILNKYNISATFFVSGSWCQKYPESVSALHSAGHEIGSHSNTHADLTRLDKAGIQQEIRLCNEKIRAITGQDTLLFRAPSGAYNALVIETVLEEGMLPIQWDCDSIDYRDPPPEEMRARIMEKLRPGSITLFHSGAKNTPEALPGIIEAAGAQGYTFVSVSQLVYPPPYTLDHEGRQSKA